MLSFQDKKYLHETFVTKKEHDQFANSVAMEFLRVNKRFDKLENLITEVLLEVRDINGKLDATIKRTDRIEAHLGLAIA
jgi:hypothetical protein